MGASASPSDDSFDLDSIRDWMVAHSRPLLIGGAVVVVTVAGVLFARQSAALRSQRAETAYISAQGTYYSGNQTQAKTELEALVARYPGTNGGTQGAMLLAQVLYREGKYDEGIKRLTDAQRSAPKQFAAAIEELIAAGYADSNRPEQAAEHYLQAAAKSPYPAEQDSYRADAARVLGMAGKLDRAKAIWESLAAKPSSPSATEAKLRLGEMGAKPIG